MRRLLPLAILALAACALAQDDDPLLHYRFDGDPVGRCVDASGHGLDAECVAMRTASPLGEALALDGTGATVARLELPEDAAFGTGSWSFAAWLKPTRLAIEDAQNQRRIFSFGAFPDANIVIDITAGGNVLYYLCYRGQDGAIASAGGGTSLALAEGAWAHATVVCDREARTVSLYVNGYRDGLSQLPPGFDGDFSAHRELTIGSGWHNFDGLVDEVRVYRRALTKQEVRAMFTQDADAFGAQASPLALAAERREIAQEALDGVRPAWEAGDWPTVRELTAQVSSEASMPAYARSFAHLLAAESYVREGLLAEARGEFERIVAESEYPEVHRAEAAERALEVAREGRGLPARDPEASRTQVADPNRFAVEVYLAPDGDDAADGTAGAPVATFGRARDLLRERRVTDPGAAIVHVAAGEYPARETLTLAIEDGGAPEAPVIWRAEGGRACLYGGARLTGFETVTDPAILARMPEEARGAVLQCDLRANGVTDFGELSTRGFSQPPSPPTLEVYVDGVPMTPARWPNEGFVKATRLVEPGDRAAGRPSVFEYADDRHARWVSAPDAWLFGYFRWLWADASIAVGRIDPAARTITTAEGYAYGGGMSMEQGIQYYAYNLLEEIDAPGEWYLDRSSGILYLLPPADLSQATVEVGLFDRPMVAAKGVANLRLEGLTFDLGRYQGVVLEDASDCLLAGCTVSRMADGGVLVHGGERVTLLGCDVHTTGRRGVELIGGDRATLRPGGHVIENCTIRSVGRIDRTYTPCIQLEGVGNRVAHNVLSDCPSSAIRIEGNDHQIEYNVFHSVVLESDDQGAIDIFANPSYRGVVYRYNIFHHIGNTLSSAGVHGQAGIRFDDAISGQLVYGNVFYRSANGNFGGVQMNSGRDNVMENNLFVACKQGISGGWYPGNGVWQGLRAGEVAGIYRNDLYLARYPEIGRMLDDRGRNFAWGNLFLGCGRVANNPDGLDQFANEEGAAEGIFADPEAGDFTLLADSPVTRALGFRPLPVGEIGLYESPYRASWPVDPRPVALGG